MSTNDKEMQRVLLNPDSLIMSDELEDLIDLDPGSREDTTIEISETVYGASVVSMARDESGINISLKVPDFSFNVFMINTSAVFNLNEEIYSCSLTSVAKELDNTVLSIFVPGI